MPQPQEAIQSTSPTSLSELFWFDSCAQRSHQLSALLPPHQRVAPAELTPAFPKRMHCSCVLKSQLATTDTPTQKTYFF